MFSRKASFVSERVGGRLTRGRVRGQAHTVDQLRSLGPVLQMVLQRVCALVVRATDGRDGRLVHGVVHGVDVGVDGVCHAAGCGVVLCK